MGGLSWVCIVNNNRDTRQSPVLERRPWRARPEALGAPGAERHGGYPGGRSPHRTSYLSPRLQIADMLDGGMSLADIAARLKAKQITVPMATRTGRLRRCGRRSSGETRYLAADGSS